MSSARWEAEVGRLSAACAARTLVPTPGRAGRNEYTQFVPPLPTGTAVRRAILRPDDAPDIFGCEREALALPHAQFHGGFQCVGPRHGIHQNYLQRGQRLERLFHHHFHLCRYLGRDEQDIRVNCAEKAQQLSIDGVMRYLAVNRDPSDRTQMLIDLPRLLRPKPYESGTYVHYLATYEFTTTISLCPVLPGRYRSSGIPAWHRIFVLAPRLKKSAAKFHLVNHYRR